ncbi:MAG: extracellular solute-binding protein [Clostridiales bacterium]|nr:extracellular solute-binding protein [Clostridiales bacterium]
MKKARRAKKRMLAVILALCTGMSLAAGCGQNEEYDSADSVFSEQTEEATETENQLYISVVGNTLDAYIKNLESVETPPDTLIVYTETVYSDSVVMQLNELLYENGYDFQVQMRQIPSELFDDVTPTELLAAMREENIAADIIPAYSRYVREAAAAGELADLTEYLETEAGNDLKDVLSDQVYEIAGYQDGVFAVGNLYAPEPAGWAANTELMEKYGLTADDLAKPLTELEDVFARVTEGEKENESFAAFSFVPVYLTCNLPVWTYSLSFPIGYWTDGEEEEIRVVNLFDTEEMRKLAGTMNDYYQKGYIRESGDQTAEEDFLMQADFNGFPICRSDSLDTWTNVNGIILTRIPYYEQDTTALNYELSCIAQSSGHQDEAFAFLNFIYTDQDAANLLRYGIENEDYAVTNEGVEMEGLESEYTVFHKSLGSVFASSVITPFETSGKTEINMDTLSTVKSNPLYGFTFDASAVAEEAAAVTELYLDNNAMRGIFLFEPSDNMFDVSDWEEYYDSFNDALKEAGIDAVVEEMNRQIQEYLDDAD